MRARLAVLLIILAATPFQARPADIRDCARCHQNPAMAPSLKNQYGVPKSLYVDPQEFERSWHYTIGKKTQCKLCHDDIKDYPHQRSEPLQCVSCHEDERRAAFRRIEAKVERSVHRELGCNDCHDPHANKPADRMTLAEKNRGCLQCHQHGMSDGRAAAFEPIPTALYHDWHPQAELHLERMACVVCHTGLGEGAEDPATAQDKHMILAKDQATKECGVCHSGGGKVARYLIDVGMEQGNQTPAEVLKRIYLVGGTREKWIEIIGGSLLTLTLIGVFGHGFIRVGASIWRRP